MATPIPDRPSTPMLAHSALPGSSDPIPEPPAQLADDRGVVSSKGALQMDGVRYGTPAPPMSSMTPPPSSQVPRRDLSPSASPVSKVEPAAVGRTPLPMASLFSSPPLTTFVDPLHAADASSSKEYKAPRQDAVLNATTEELRSMLENSMNEVERLGGACREARTLAAHYKFQHNLLSIETDEAVQRMNVEYEMSRREVEVLQRADHPHQYTSSFSNRGSPVGPPNESNVFGRLALEMKRECQTMKAEVDLLNRRLKKAKKLILHREGEIASYKEENGQLRQRILENRDHLNQFRRPGGLFDTSPRQPHSSPSKTRTDDSIDAILLADQVLNQGHATAPSTPMRHMNAKQSRFGHSRGAHSLSSLPSTPVQRRPLPNPGYSLAPAQPETPRGRSTPRANETPGSKRRRRESRDSTISASDQEDRPRSPYQGNDDDGSVLDSPASQMATKMLRRSAEQQGHLPRSPRGKSNGLNQAKLFGQVKKPPGQRIVHLGLGNSPDGRAQPSAAEVRHSKNLKSDAGVGLGIGNWSPTRG